MKIKTRIIPATDTKGTKIQAHGFGRSMTIPYPYELSTYQAHLRCADMLWNRFHTCQAHHEDLGDYIPKGRSEPVGYVFDFKAINHIKAKNEDQ